MLPLFGCLQGAVQTAPDANAAAETECHVWCRERSPQDSRTPSDESVCPAPSHLLPAARAGTIPDAWDVKCTWARTENACSGCSECHGGGSAAPSSASPARASAAAPTPSVPAASVPAPHAPNRALDCGVADHCGCSGEETRIIRYHKTGCVLTSNWIDDLDEVLPTARTPDESSVGPPLSASRTHAPIAPYRSAAGRAGATAPCSGGCRTATAWPRCARSSSRPDGASSRPRSSRAAAPRAASPSARGTWKSAPLRRPCLSFSTTTITVCVATL